MGLSSSKLRDAFPFLFANKQDSSIPSTHLAGTCQFEFGGMVDVDPSHMKIFSVWPIGAHYFAHSPYATCGATGDGLLEGPEWLFHKMKCRLLVKLSLANRKL
jgi:hypothetical protein